ncbi:MULTISPECIES: FecR domain-containing protein [Leptospira]|uniref:Sigma factor regulatory protein, FecR/PupR family n=5 Tax=Leptospira borgpetersenii TaxID=174 RepID=M3HJ17_LEPBO|nr:MULTISPECIES: FecR family protein [Leptospira]EMF98060.1 sigma factor regulatory protein, FecR/PupR family [Leptospira borgpetersenii str. 200701203]EMO11223.1 sigma factor regulatory protein, FecR/PupR family [Leptospira borgpetersenii str. Noumea 25]ALO24512.1 sigma factor regulatory protein, FecR/PupR family [Leptospira borgpetersenii serovar Ballum]ANG99665.1 Sigma factor regulatory protein, FecR/PupR family [Leptospira borgpetersenii str. 4E]AXX14285.1 iron dicitrate transport regulato
MKRYLFITVICMLSTVCSTNKSSGSDQVKTESNTAVARIVWILGDVKILSDSGERKAELGAVLTSNDRIVTGSNGGAEIMVSDSGVVKMSKNSNIEISTLMNPNGLDTNVQVNYGKIVTMVKKNQKTTEFTVSTPTALAGVRGTSFLTSVESPQGSRINCAKENCTVRFAVIEGTIAVSKKGESSEVILNKNRELRIEKNQKLTDKLIRSLQNDSLTEMKELIVLHKNETFEYGKLVEELKSSSEELKILSQSGSVEEVKAEFQKREADRNNADEVTKIAKAVNETKYVQQDVQKEKLKLNPKESF